METDIADDAKIRDSRVFAIILGNLHRGSRRFLSACHPEAHLLREGSPGMFRTELLRAWLFYEKPSSFGRGALYVQLSRKHRRRSFAQQRGSG